MTEKQKQVMSIADMLKAYYANDDKALTDILTQMTPLAKKYASKIHFMEFEDAMQEMYLTLMETLPYLGPDKQEGEILGYMKKAVFNKYRFLCKRALTARERLTEESLEDQSEISRESDDFQNVITECDILLYIDKIKKQDARG